MEQSQSPYKAIALRALAYVIDCACCFGLYLIIQLPLYVLRPSFGLDQSWFQSGWNTQLYTLATISLPTWLYFALMESSSAQGTLGKWIVRLIVCDRFSNGRLGFGPAIVRTAIKLLPWELMHIGNNLPTPIWYTDEPGFRIAFLIAVILMPAYIILILMNKNRQAPYDLIAGSIVRGPIKIAKGQLRPLKSRDQV